MRRKIIVIGCMDGFANSVRPNKIKSFLERHGYEVELLNTFSKEKIGLSSHMKIFLLPFIPKIIKNKLFIDKLNRRAEKLSTIICEKKPFAVICESEQDSYVLTKNLGCIKIYDAASPWVDEYYYSGFLTDKYYQKLRAMEIEIYKQSDYVSFHWENYTRYVRKHIYKGNNLFRMDWGCSPKKKIAHYSSQPRIIFMGYLKGYWNNMPLLSRLSKKYNIDVYGGPKPPKKFGLNYKGYAPSTDILSEYQFGLITITDDPLRKCSFSSKHLEYMSYGLPILTPKWRNDPDLKKFSILYDENNFLDKIKDFTDKKKWMSMSKKCYEQSKHWEWENQLLPLLRILNKK